MAQKSQSDYFAAKNIQYIDYKDVETLKRFLNPHGRIMARRRTGISAKHQ
ncbi:30S ribosomal protein S18, partial [Candidatus Kaiserbacteria bacterium RIFCSPLOWO2_01_FULL_51_21]